LCGFSKVFILSKKLFSQFSCLNCHPRPKSKRRGEKKMEKFSAMLSADKFLMRKIYRKFISFLVLT
jgi:hypothetical protein